LIVDSFERNWARFTEVARFTIGSGIMVWETGFDPAGRLWIFLGGFALAGGPAIKYVAQIFDALKSGRIQISFVAAEDPPVPIVKVEVPVLDAGATEPADEAE
jgi:hypothetical protein